MEALVQYCARRMLEATIVRLGYMPPQKAINEWLRQYEADCRRKFKMVGLLGVGVVALLFFGRRRG